MPYFDKHMQFINEVVDFARSGPLLRPVGGASGVRTITDFEQAKHLCWDEVFGDEEYTWTDLRERQMSKVHGIGYQIGGYRDERGELDSFLGIILNSFDDRVDEKYRDIFDDVTADLCNCLESRAIQGNAPGFFEILFEVYRQGLWPCGWEGNFPDGRPIAYVPAS
jgi:hypothetical protein